MSWLLMIGIAAGVLQLAGYFFYLTNHKIEPNPVTWFMFAYGTALLVILEWDKDATLAELILPTSCAVLSVVVSLKCWMRARKINPSKWWPNDWWPEDKLEQVSFVSDMLITLAYVCAWGLASFALLTSESREMAVFWFLLLSNISTFPSFYPILNSTIKNPSTEHWLPWTLWTLAYLLLALVTYHTHNSLWHILMFYPLSNVFLHALVAIVSIEPLSQLLKQYVQKT